MAGKDGLVAGAKGLGPLGMDGRRLRGFSDPPCDHGQVLLCDPGRCCSTLPSPLIVEEGRPPKRGGGTGEVKSISLGVGAPAWIVSSSPGAM